VEKGHGGVCRVVKRFRSASLAEVARSVEGEYASAFEPFRASFRVLPIKISHLLSLGEGVALHLFPHEPRRWPWWGDFEADLEVRRRPRFSREWVDLKTSAELGRWLRQQTEQYLATLRGTSATDQ
jgi:hypothetical protein